MPFRFQGRFLFLTYSQCDVHPDTIISAIRTKCKPVFILVGVERHVDGGHHRHVFIDFGQRFSFTSERRFDIDGYHPNIVKPNSPKDCLAYCSKDGDTHTFGEAPTFSTKDQRVSRSDCYRRLLDDSTSAAEFLQGVRDTDPYTFCTRYEALRSMAASVFQRRTPYESPYEPQDFNLPQGVEGMALGGI